MADNKIFVSYRRQDASGEAGRLVDHLQEVFGDDSVFLDVETIEAGLDFIQAIEKALSSCKVLIAMIGPHWATMKDPQGNLRLFNKDDFIRIEISAALKRDIRVIPVLVNGAMMPNPEDLPEDLQGLTRRHAQELSSSRWKYDSDQLTSVLSKIIEPKPQPKPQPKSEPVSRPLIPNPPVPKSWWAKNYLWVIGGVVGFLILIGMCVPDEPQYEPIVDSDGTTQTDLSTENPDGNEIYNSLLLDESIPNVSGRWTGVNDLGLTYYYDISQDGESVSFNEISFDGSIIGSGTGVVNGEYINLDYNSVFNYSGSITLVISPDQTQLSGQVSIPSSGVSASMLLNRN
jgi:hypothetical protein